MKRIWKLFHKTRPALAEGIMDFSCQVVWDAREETKSGQEPKWADLPDQHKDRLRQQLREHMNGTGG